MNEKFSWNEIGLFIAAAVGALVTAFKAIGPVLHKQRQEHRKSINDDLSFINDRLTSENDRVRAEIHAERNKLSERELELSICREEKARLEERIIYLEDLLDRRQIKFRRWRANDSNPYMDVTEPDK